MLIIRGVTFNPALGSNTTPNEVGSSSVNPCIYSVNHAPIAAPVIVIMTRVVIVTIAIIITYGLLVRFFSLQSNISSLFISEFACIGRQNGRNANFVVFLFMFLSFHVLSVKGSSRMQKHLCACRPLCGSYPLGPLFPISYFQFFHSLVHSFIRSCIHELGIHSFICSLHRSFTISSFIHRFIRLR